MLAWGASVCVFVRGGGMLDGWGLLVALCLVSQLPKGSANTEKWGPSPFPCPHLPTYIPAQCPPMSLPTYIHAQLCPCPAMSLPIHVACPCPPMSLPYPLPTYVPVQLL